MEESKDEDAAVLTEPTLTAGRMLPWKPKPKQVSVLESRSQPGTTQGKSANTDSLVVRTVALPTTFCALHSLIETWLTFRFVGYETRCCANLILMSEYYFTALVPDTGYRVLFLVRPRCAVF